MIYSNPDFLILRSPLIPFNKIFSTEIRDILNNANFIEGLFLASPNLYNEIKKCNGTIQLKEREKLFLTVYRYWLRASFRCTPFGIFAGLSLGKFSEATMIELSDYNKYEKNSRLDTHFLSSFVKMILLDENVRNSVKWFVNNTRYKILDKLRYIKYRLDKNSRTHHLSNVTNTEYVELVLNQARKGATLNELISAIVNEDIEWNEAKDFVNEMISECLLVSELEPCVTGMQYQEQLLLKLQEIKSANVFLEILRSTINRLVSADKNGIGLSPDYYLDIINKFKYYQIDFDLGKLLQCDLYKPVENFRIGNIVKEELNNTIRLLSKITPLPRQTNIGKFKEEFLKRYDGKEMPLLEVLDPEIGLGYPANRHATSDNTPLLNNVFFKSEKKPKLPNWKEDWTSFLFKKLEKANKSNSIEIEIKDHEIMNLFPDDNNLSTLPDSAFTLCSILSPSSAEIDKGNFKIDHSLTSGPSLADYLGRFCFMNEELKKNVQKAIAKEENLYPDKVFGEILHIPEARVGNILIRPLLREYEIPILTMPTVDENHHLPLEDLMVSVRHNRVYLRSRRINKEIIPRLTTAHNFALNSVPHYHFLCDLQYQNTKNILFWNWGVLHHFSFLPRVRYGRTILSKASWVIKLEELSNSKKIDNSKLSKKLCSYFEQNNIPKLVTISHGDNQLLINIENQYCLNILAQDIKKYGIILLNECLFNKTNLIVKGHEGLFTNELIIPWIKNRPIQQKSKLRPEVNENGTKKVYVPGTEWHYIKLYCGVKSADKILVDIIKPITEELLENGIISKFFFIRYTDPDHHIRIRFLGEGNFFSLITIIINEKIKSYLKNGLVWKIQSDTYDREIQRYGCRNIDNSESLFFFDSMSCLNILRHLDGDEGDDLRWLFALKGVDSMLNSFGLDLQEKRKFISVISTRFLKEFNANNTEIKKQLSTKYRNEKLKMHLAFQDKLEKSHEYFPIWKIFQNRKKSFALCVNYIDKLIEKGQLEVEKYDLLASYVHMFLNRFFRSKQRLQEMVLYDLLHQHYKSLIAQKKNTFQER